MAAVLLAAGADLDLPSVEGLDELLGMSHGQVSDLSPEDRELREALGLRG